MGKWTTAAQEELTRYLAEIKPALENSGADSGEVFDDIRRRIEEEAAQSKLHVVTDEDVRRILRRMGAPEPDAPRHKPVQAQEPAPRSLPRPSFGDVVFWFGIALSSLTLGFESWTHACADIVFDPIPTPFHAFLVGLVPAGSVAVWLGSRRKDERWAGPLAMLAGCCLGVASLYALLFLPILPIALLGLIMVVGLLPLSPYFALTSALLALRELRRNLPSARAWHLGLGMILAGAALTAVELPQLLTRVGLGLAAEPASALDGIWLLRNFGDEELLRRTCYLRQGRATDIVTLVIGGKPVPPEEARKVYYRVYGLPFNSVPPPKNLKTLGNDASARRFSFDADQGGDTVSERLRDLWMASSRLDGSIDADAALAYLEWTLTFRNDAANDQEARAVLSLPPGGVVSRVTLWINGEEREAAFGSRAATRQAYEKVVKARRDPLLVTTKGPGQVLVQCFPVPARGGGMKIRIGITAPLTLPSLAKATLRLPRIAERNFGIDQARHEVWLESKRPLAGASPKLTAEAAPTGAYALRGSLEDRRLLEEGVIHASRAADVRRAWSADAPGAFTVAQTIQQTTRSAAAGAIVVVDGSRAMRPQLRALALALASAPPGSVRSVILVASDRPWEYAPREAAARLGRLSAKGGQDNVPALVQAWDLAARQGGAPILWIHGPQPVELSAVEALRQRLERRPNGPVLYALDATGGPNRVLEGLDGAPGVRQAATYGSPADDARAILAGWAAGARETRADRSLGSSAGAVKTSDHLVRLWASDQVGRLLGSPKPENRLKATELAYRHRLVTPVTGAVVLETAQEYKDAGLVATDAMKVPVVPEPQTWALLLMALLAAAWGTRRRQPCAA